MNAANFDFDWIVYPDEHGGSRLAAAMFSRRFQNARIVADNGFTKDPTSFTCETIRKEAEVRNQRVLYVAPFFYGGGRLSTEALNERFGLNSHITVVAYGLSPSLTVDGHIDIYNTLEFLPLTYMIDPIYEAVLANEKSPIQEAVYRGLLHKIHGQDPFIAARSSVFCESRWDELYAVGVIVLSVMQVHADDLVTHRSVPVTFGGRAATLVCCSDMGVMYYAAAAAKKTGVGIAWRLNPVAGTTLITICTQDSSPYTFVNSSAVTPNAFLTEKGIGGGSDNTAGATIKQLVLPPTKDIILEEYLQPYFTS